MELTKASWTAEVDVGGFHRRRNYAITAKSPGAFDLTVPSVNSFKCQGWGQEAVSCPSKVPIPRENGDKKKDTSQLLWR